MPQFTSFSINDGSATPVAVTYSPELLSSSQTVLVDRRLTTREQQPTISYVFDRANPARKSTYKVKVDVGYPIVSIVAGTEAVSDTARGKAEFIIPVSASVDARKHLRAALANALDQAYVKAGVEDLDPIY